MAVKYNTVQIMDIDFINISRYSFLKNIVYPAIEQQQKCFIITANPEVVMATRDDPDFKAIVKSANYVLADGVGIINASKLVHNPIKERVTGVDLMYDLLKYASENKKRVFFLGASEEVNAKVIEIVEKEYPGLIIAGRKNGYFNKYDDEIADYIAGTKPDILFAALGAKRQEGWIHHYMDKFDKGIFIGIGGSFDVLSGQVRRAPEIWIKLQLEWLYRLLKQPFRTKRILKVFEFMLLHVPVIKRIMKWLGFSKSKPRSTRDGIR